MMQTALIRAPSQDLTAKTEDSGSIGRKRRLFRAFETNKQREVEEQKTARRYYSGRQWTDAEIAVLRRRKQPVIWDNRIARKIDFLVGVEQRMRRDPKAFARGPADHQSADVATACVRYVCDQNRWESMASASAHDALVAGIGVTWIGIENGPRGLDVKLKAGQVDRFFYDPRSTMPDFSDARYMGMHLWLDIDDVKAEYPDLEEQLGDMVDRDGGLGTSALETERDEAWADFEQQRVRVVEMYERKPRPKAEGGGYAWYFCKFTGDLTLEAMWSPYLDENGVPDCPYVAWSPYVDERGDRYGVVRNMRPMQDEINQRRSKLLHRTNVRQIHMVDGVVEDVDETRNELAKPDGVVRHQGKWGENIGLIDQSNEMKGEAELLAQAQSSLENLGPNPGLIGKGGGVADQSGRAILAQRDSGMTELSPVFERLRDWKLRCYRKMYARIKQSWTAQKTINITENKDAPKYITLNQYDTDPMTGMATASNVIGQIDVDIILDEGPDTIVMQEELMQTLSQLGEAAMGPLGKVMIELSQVSNKDTLLQMMEKVNAPPPEVVAVQKRLADIEAALKEASVAKAHAETENKRADTALKLSQAMIPPQALPPMFPIPFGDMGGMGGQPQGMAPPPQMMPPGMPPPGMQPPMPQQPPQQGMPDQMAQLSPNGALPISNELAGGMSGGITGA